MRRALKEAGITPDVIDHINTHGTSTPAGDIPEILGIKSVFGEHTYDMSINSGKSMTGHLLGGAGGCLGALAGDRAAGHSGRRIRFLRALDAGGQVLGALLLEPLRRACRRERAGVPVRLSTAPAPPDRALYQKRQRAGGLSRRRADEPQRKISRPRRRKDGSSRRRLLFQDVSGCR